MLIDGEKWACEACVRGHRVSNCNHHGGPRPRGGQPLAPLELRAARLGKEKREKETHDGNFWATGADCASSPDRPLQHINKKGRPVSQCQHCRSMRKSRSSHVKCDCGEKTHKCQHLQPTVPGHSDSCCCNHGGRCSCSHKKETPLDTVPESDSDQEPQHSKAKATARRRRANTTHSEPVLSFDELGHHKPHKHNRASQKCGPYTLSRGHSMHSTSSVSSMGTRSVDNLVHKAPTRSRSKDLVAHNLDPRKAKSEQASPLINGGSAFQQLNGQLPPLDLSNIQYPEYTPAFELFHGLEEQPMFSAGLSAPSVDWAQYDGLDMKAESFASSSYDQGHSYAPYEFGSTEPTLTSNSGDVSETEDFVPAFSDAQIEGFRLSAASDYMNMQQSQQSQSTLADSDFGHADFGSFKAAAAANKFLPNLGSLEDTNNGFPLIEEDSYWSMNNFADGITNSPDPVATTFWDTQ